MASIHEEVTVKLENKPGALARALRAVADAGANVLGFCGYGENGSGKLLVIASQTAAAAEALKKAGFGVELHPVVITEVEDRVGAAAELAEKIAAKGVNVLYAYASGAGKGRTTVVFRTNDNGAARGAID